MPELPEVETIKRGLSRVLIDKKIKNIKVLSRKQFQGNPKNLIAKKIQKITRRAKILIFKLSQDLYLVVHLKLSGQLIYSSKNAKGKIINYEGLKKSAKEKFVIGGHPQKEYLEELPNKYTRIIILFSDSSHLYFNDLRKFGWFKLLNHSQVEKILSEFGPEVLTLKLSEFKKIISQGSGPTIKQLLMDQKKLAGVGNIYSDEALFCAGISPFRSVKKIEFSEVKKLLVCLKKVLNLSLKCQGISDRFYRTSSGGIGTFSKIAKVYHREKQKCLRCKNRIIRKKIGSRSTHFCNHCQI